MRKRREPMKTNQQSKTEAQKQLSLYHKSHNKFKETHKAEHLAKAYQALSALLVALKPQENNNG
jgi:hypothetical protein